MRLTLSIIAILATAAHADHVHYQRHPDVVPHVTPRAAGLRHPSPPPRPAVTADDVLAIEEGNQPIRVQQEKMLETLVRDTPDDAPEKPELLLRLAEQYARQLRFWKLKAVEATIRPPHR